MNYISSQYLLDNKDIFFNNNGEMLRYYLDVSDLASIVFRLIKIENFSGLFNIIGPCKLTIKELILKFENILNYKFKVEFQNIESLDNIRIVDDNKIKSKLNYNFMNNVDSFIGKQKK